jgi:transcriptional regulator with XRE-family HTH domain
MSNVVTLSGASLRARTAEEIRAVLGRRRMSESALARAIGASQAYVWRRLSGEIPLDLDDLEKIAAALSVDVSALIPISDLIERASTRARAA